MVDDFSRAVWVFLLIDKKDVDGFVKDFFAMVERQFQKKIKIVRSDNGIEFACLKSFFHEHGVIFQTSVLAHLNRMDEWRENISIF